MGMGIFQQKEPKNARRPQNWCSQFRPQNCGRKFYGHHAFSEISFLSFCDFPFSSGWSRFGLVIVRPRHGSSGSGGWHGSGFGSWETVPVPISVPKELFRQFRFPVPARFLRYGSGFQFRLGSCGILFLFSSGIFLICAPSGCFLCSVQQEDLQGSDAAPLQTLFLLLRFPPP